MRQGCLLRFAFCVPFRSASWFSLEVLYSFVLLASVYVIAHQGELVCKMF